jgi:hypothetical protein
MLPSFTVSGLKLDVADAVVVGIYVLALTNCDGCDHSATSKLPKQLYQVLHAQAPVLATIAIQAGPFAGATCLVYHT